MADNIDEKSRSPVDANTKAAGSDLCTMAADLPSAEEGSLNNIAVSTDGGEEVVINLVNGAPRYLLAFGLMCALFCVSLAFCLKETTGINTNPRYEQTSMDVTIIGSEPFLLQKALR